MKTRKLLQKCVLFTGLLVMATPMITGGITANASRWSVTGHHARGGGNTPGTWKTITGKNAFDKFLNGPFSKTYNGAHGKKEKESVLKDVAGLDSTDIKNCEKSTTVAFYTDDGAYSHYSGLGAKNRDKIENLKPFKKYLHQDNTWKSQTATIVCSASYAPAATLRRVYYRYKLPDTVGYSAVNTQEAGEKSASLVLTGIFKTQTQITPTLLQGQSADDPKWQATHEVQTSNAEMNRWSNWATSINTGSFESDFQNNKNYKEVFNQWEAKSRALQQGDYAAHPNLELSARNRKGFAQGGVLTVSENIVPTSIGFVGHERYVRHKVFEHYAYYWRYVIHGGSYSDLSDSDQARYDDGNPHGAKSKVDGAKSGSADDATNIDGKNVAVSYVTGTHWGKKELASHYVEKGPADAVYSSSKQWQMINVRCNKDKFNELANSIPGFVNTSNANGDGSSSGHTPVYYMNGNTTLPLGNTANSGIQGESGYASFYENDQSCRMSIDCNSIRRPSASNASRNNVQNHGKNAKNSSGDATYGAQSQGVSSDTFSFFRDGKQHAIRTDLWYPVAKSNTSISVDSDSPALFTRMYFDPNGTPGKLFGIANSAGGADFLSGSQVQNGTAYRENGELVNFYPHATWASSSSNPERFNIDWTWRPTITNNIYSSVNGAYPGGNTVQDKSSIYATCPIAVDTTDTHHPTIKNSLNDDPVGNLTSFDSSDKASVAIGFVRSTSDEH